MKTELNCGLRERKFFVAIKPQNGLLLVMSPSCFKPSEAEISSCATMADDPNNKVIFCQQVPDGMKDDLRQRLKEAWFRAINPLGNC